MKSKKREKEKKYTLMEIYDLLMCYLNYHVDPVVFKYFVFIFLFWGDNIDQIL